MAQAKHLMPVMATKNDRVVYVCGVGVMDSLVLPLNEVLVAVVVGS